MLRLLRIRNLLAVSAIVFAMGAAYQAMHTTEGVMSVARDERPLAAAKFRAPIARLEARLFAPGPLTMEQRMELASSFDDVRASLAGVSDSHMARFSARELGTLAAMSRGLGDLGGTDLERVRQGWMRIRANTFGDESWFRFSEADPVAPAVQPRLSLSADDRAMLEQLAPVLDRIRDQIDRGQRDAERLGEPQPDGSVESGVGEAWRSWATGWEDEVGRIRSLLPRAPDASTSLRARFAWESASHALDELAKVPGPLTGGDRPPYRIEWTRHFQNSARELESARGWTARAERGVDA